MELRGTLNVARKPQDSRASATARVVAGRFSRKQTEDCHARPRPHQLRITTTSDTINPSPHTQSHFLPYLLSQARRASLCLSHDSLLSTALPLSRLPLYVTRTTSRAAPPGAYPPPQRPSTLFRASSVKSCKRDAATASLTTTRPLAEAPEAGLLPLSSADMSQEGASSLPRSQRFGGMSHFRTIVISPQQSASQPPDGAGPLAQAASRVAAAGTSTGKGVLIGMVSAFGTAALVGLVLVIIYFFNFTQRGRILLDRLGRPGEYDDEQQFAKEEAEALEEMDEMQRMEYMRAKGKMQ